MTGRSRVVVVALVATALAATACDQSSTDTPVPSVTADGLDSPRRSTPTGEPSPTIGPTRTIAPAAPDQSSTDWSAPDEPDDDPGGEVPPGDAATATEHATDEPVEEASEIASVTGPSPAAIAALVADEVAAAGDGAQHVVTDLDGDELVEVVVAGVEDDRARVGVWWWESGRGFGDRVSLDAGPGRAVVEVRVADVTKDGVAELIVRVGGGARDSLALWSVRGPRDVRPLRAEGGCFDGSHVYGATAATLQSRGEDPPAILATCDDTPLPVADWATAVYEFRDGAYRFVPSGIGGVDRDQVVPTEPVEEVTSGPGVGRDTDGPADR